MPNFITIGQTVAGIWRFNGFFAILKVHNNRDISSTVRPFFTKFARLCKMGLLTVLTVKQFEFPKSKMADGRHFERNRLIVICQQPFDRFWWNLAGWRKFAPYRDRLLKFWIKKDGSGRHLEKPQKWRYHNNELTDLREIWHDYAKWVS